MESVCAWVWRPLAVRHSYLQQIRDIRMMEALDQGGCMSPHFPPGEGAERIGKGVQEAQLFVQVERRKREFPVLEHFSG
jgi:hypothetical protein